MKAGHRCPACHRWTRRKRRTMSAVVNDQVRSVPDERCAVCVKRGHFPEVAARVAPSSVSPASVAAPAARVASTQLGMIEGAT